jgi:REP element-mobilizing transposase RayT
MLYGRGEKMVDYQTGGHSVYSIKYHFVWVTKYRYHVLHGEIAERARKSDKAMLYGKRHNNNERKCG